MHTVISHISEEKAIFGVFISDGTFSSQTDNCWNSWQQSYIKIPAEMPLHTTQLHTTQLHT